MFLFSYNFMIKCVLSLLLSEPWCLSALVAKENGHYMKGVNS